MYLLQGNIRVEWPGWTDTPSGIKGYELEIFKMQKYEDELGVPTDYLISHQFNQIVTHFDVELGDPGMSLNHIKLFNKKSIFTLFIFYIKGCTAFCS